MVAPPLLSASAESAELASRKVPQASERTLRRKLQRQHTLVCLKAALAFHRNKVPLKHALLCEDLEGFRGKLYCPEPPGGGFENIKGGDLVRAEQQLAASSESLKSHMQDIYINNSNPISPAIGTPPHNGSTISPVIGTTPSDNGGNNILSHDLSLQEYLYSGSYPSFSFPNAPLNNVNKFGTAIAVSPVIGSLPLDGCQIPGIGISPHKGNITGISPHNGRKGIFENIGGDSSNNSSCSSSDSECESSHDLCTFSSKSEVFVASRTCKISKISLAGLYFSSSCRLTVPALFDSHATASVNNLMPCTVAPSPPFSLGHSQPAPGLKALLKARGEYKRQMVAKGRRPKPAFYKQLSAAMHGSNYNDKMPFRLPS